MKKEKINLDVGDYLRLKQVFEEQIRGGLVAKIMLKWLNKELEKYKLPALPQSASLSGSQLATQSDTPQQ